MSNEMVHTLISKMHIRLGKLIEQHNFDLMNDEVLRYSRRLDRVILKFVRMKNQKSSSKR